jgi:hypothetical protein
MNFSSSIEFLFFCLLHVHPTYSKFFWIHTSSSTRDSLSWNVFYFTLPIKSNFKHFTQLCIFSNTYYCASQRTDTPAFFFSFESPHKAHPIMALEPRFFKVSRPILRNRASFGPADGINRRGFLLRVRLYPNRWRATCSRCYIFILLYPGRGGTHRPDWSEITKYVGCCTSDAVAGGATRRGFHLRVRRYLILRCLMLLSLDIPFFHTSILVFDVLTKHPNSAPCDFNVVHRNSRLGRYTQLNMAST